MDHHWSQEWRNRNDARARQLWLDMEQRVWRDARIFSGLEPPPSMPEMPDMPDSSDDLDLLTEAEVADIGELADVDPPIPPPLAKRLFRHLRQTRPWMERR